MNKLLIICGPTATGKTKLALQLAIKFNGELISADSRQVYNGLDVLTGKDLPKERERGRGIKVPFRKKNYNLIPYIVNGVSVWMYDVVYPSEVFSVAHFQALALGVIADILKRGKLPIVAGGTGLYIRSLIRPMNTIAVPQNIFLRKKLSFFSVVQLQEKLQKENHGKWENMNESDRKNSRRLIRALEITEWNKFHEDVDSARLPPDVAWIGLQTALSKLKQQIQSRVVTRIDGGALAEVERFSIENTQLPAATALGITFVKQFLDHQITRDELIDQWTNEEFSYTKRQITWFRKEQNIHWFDVDDMEYRQQVEALVAGWYTV